MYDTLCIIVVHVYILYIHYCIARYNAGIIFGGLLEKEQLADINLAVSVRLPRLLRESMRLAQYWRI